MQNKLLVLVTIIVFSNNKEKTKLCNFWLVKVKLISKDFINYKNNHSSITTLF